MTPRRIEHFLSVLARELDRPARAYVTGAAAAALWGRVRPSLDVDLGIELRGPRDPGGWQVVDNAIERTKRLTGIPANAAEEIDRWGMITLLDYRKSSRRYRRFGKLEVRLLHPINWSIGKLTRFLDSDIRDVTAVFRGNGIALGQAARTWGRALRASPASSVQFQFRRNVASFFTRQGRTIWGRTFDPASAIRSFERAARIEPRGGSSESARGQRQQVRR